MKFSIRKLSRLSGREASVYSVFIDGEQGDKFEQFLENYTQSHPDEVKDILKRIYNIGHSEGARTGFFKEKEGLPGDLVCALYDDPDSNLRLYCLRFGKTAVILGGGGIKPKDIKAWQESPELSRQARLMIEVSKKLAERIKDKDIVWSLNQKDLIGDLDFNDEDDD